MAYRFDGVDDYVTFDPAPLVGHTFGVGGPVTVACLVKLGADVNVPFVGVATPPTTGRLVFGWNTSATDQLTATMGSTRTLNHTLSVGAWYIVVATFSGTSGQLIRGHVYNGTAWTHANFTSGITLSATAVASGDALRVGRAAATTFLNGDMVCVGIKKTDSSDAAVEALSYTLFQAWLDFGFDWLAGFKAAGAVQDQGTAGTGDETARVGTTLVSDPAGWTWPAVTTHYGATSSALAFAAAVAGTASTPATLYGAVSRTVTFAAATAGDITVGTTLYGATSMFTIFGAHTAGSESSASLLPPADLVAVPVSETQVNLDWEPSAGATGYRVERATSSGVFVEIATTTDTSYADTGLDPSTYYVYRVRADDGDDLSAYTADDGDAVTDVLPTEGVSIAYGSALLDPNPAWTRIDVGSVVAEFSIRRGRQDELEKTGTGTASIRINDRTGDFAPGSLDGRQIALALWNPVTDTSHTIFRGFADSYSYDAHPSGFVTYVDIEAVDALDYLAGVEIAPGTAGDDHTIYPDVNVASGDVWYIGDQVNYRIHALLCEAGNEEAAPRPGKPVLNGWPPELRTIFTGNVWVKEQVAAAGTSILSLLQDAADAEFPGVANLYVSKLGKVTFHGRLARFDPEGTAASAGTAWKFTRWKAGDGSATTDPSYAQLRGLGFTRDRKRIINAALAYPYRADGVEAPLTTAQMTGQIVTSPSSIDAYGLHSWSAESLMTHRHKASAAGPTNNDLTETKKMATYYVQNYAQPQTRLTRLEFRSLRPDDPRAPATWALLCGVEISDVVQVKAAGFADTEFYVEGISYDVRPAGPEYHDVTLSLDVSPVAYYDSNPFDDE